ncbi:bifunctional lysine ketoglutarate reductase /saccharopine dehydrogenase family protein [Thermoplasmatota archaeon]
MSIKFGIRREDKNKWERRVPIIPNHIKELKNNHDDIDVIVQPSKIRAFSDENYMDSGAEIKEDLSDCKVVFAVKEIPLDFFQLNTTYVFFSHTIKGQKYNMPLLKKMMNLKCNLIDYESITDNKGFRLVFFGRYAGLAGMIDTLWSFGQRMKLNNIETPFNSIKQTIYYNNLDEVKDHFKGIMDEIKNNGIPKELCPFIVGFAGYGHVSKGAQEILDILPVKEISPEEISGIFDKPSNKCIYKVIFKEKDMVEPILKEDDFELQDYYNNPEKYKSKFEKYVSQLAILMNCIYWDSRYPRLISKAFLKKNFDKIKLKVIGDISIDINGAIEFTEKSTTSDNPSFVYNPNTNSVKDGVDGEGIVVMGVDNLPCELPIESSKEFSNSLFDFIIDIVRADYSKDFNNCNLPEEIKRAVILYHGELTHDYSYMGKYL